MRSREEHLAWCKQKAQECVAQGNLKGAVASMISDLNKHSETAIDNPFLTIVGMMHVADNDTPGVRRWIDGFN
jgi:hypothetical protein